MGHDDQVDPTAMMFHVMVPGVVPGETAGQPHFAYDSVNTGFVLPNGQELPFWHVMFDVVGLEAESACARVHVARRRVPGVR